MKDSGYIIKIDTPCSEDFSSMTKNEFGKYCSSCSKNVIDFTQHTDKQIIEFLNKKPGNLCGTFREDQLNRPFIQPSNKSTSFPWYRLVAGFLLLFTSENANAREQKVETKIVSAYGSENLSEQKVDNDTDPITTHPDSISHIKIGNKGVLSGTVINNETGYPVVNAEIKIDTLLLGTTDGSGEFKVTVNKSLFSGNMVKIHIQHPDYKEYMFFVRSEELPKKAVKISLTLNPNTYKETGRTGGPATISPIYIRKK